MEAADALLPLTADGQPALPAGTLEGQQAEVQAMLLAATAGHISPCRVEWEGQPQERLYSYLRRRADLVGGRSWEAAYLPALQPLGGLLLLHCRGNMTDHTRSLRLRSDALAILELRRSTVSRQLQQVQRSSAHQLLAADQLEAAIHHQLIARSVAVLNNCAQPPGEPGRLVLSPSACAPSAATVVASGERLLALQPGSPHATLAAAQGLVSAGSVRCRTDAAGATALLQRSMDLFVRAFREAQAAHSGFWALVAGGQALAARLAQQVSVPPADLAALVAAAEGAGAASKKLCRLLPQSWAAVTNWAAAASAAALPAARAQLQQGRSSAAQRQAAFDLFPAIDAAGIAASTCAGCGKRALGLRRCGRCKQVACKWDGEWLGL